METTSILTRRRNCDSALPEAFTSLNYKWRSEFLQSGDDFSCRAQSFIAIIPPTFFFLFLANRGGSESVGVAVWDCIEVGNR